MSAKDHVQDHTALRPWRAIQRRPSRKIRVGNVEVGGDAPITVQSMTNTLTSDAQATINQVRELEEAGADIVRVSCPDEDSTRAFKAIVKIDLRKVTFDDGGVASSWKPADHVVLDPRVQAGAPVVNGTRIPTATIEDLAESQTPDEIAEEYRVPVVKVRAALEFQRRLRAGEGLAA